MTSQTILRKAITVTQEKWFEPWRHQSDDWFLGLQGSCCAIPVLNSVGPNLSMVPRRRLTSIPTASTSGAWDMKYFRRQTSPTLTDSHWHANPDTQTRHLSPPFHRPPILSSLSIPWYKFQDGNVSNSPTLTTSQRGYISSAQRSSNTPVRAGVAREVIKCRGSRPRASLYHGGKCLWTRTATESFRSPWTPRCGEPNRISGGREVWVSGGRCMFPKTLETTNNQN